MVFEGDTVMNFSYYYFLHVKMLKGHAKVYNHKQIGDLF